MQENFFPDQFMMAIIGSSKSGKTRGLLEQMVAPHFPFRYNREDTDGAQIIVFSPTASLDKNFQEVMVPGIIIREAIDDDLIEEKANSGQSWLIIFDDLIGDEAHLSNHSKLPYFVTRARHWNMSMIFLSQSFKRLPLLIRRNLDILVIHKIKEDDELTQVLRAMNRGVDRNIVKQMYDYALGENIHNNLTINDKFDIDEGYFSMNYGAADFIVKKNKVRSLL